MLPIPVLVKLQANRKVKGKLIMRALPNCSAESADRAIHNSSLYRLLPRRSESQHDDHKTSAEYPSTSRTPNARCFVSETGLRVWMAAEYNSAIVCANPPPCHHCSRVSVHERQRPDPPPTIMVKLNLNILHQKSPESKSASGHDSTPLTSVSVSDGRASGAGKTCCWRWRQIYPDDGHLCGQLDQCKLELVCLTGDLLDAGIGEME